MYTGKIDINSIGNKAKRKKRKWVILPTKQSRNKTEKYNRWPREFKNWEYQINKPSVGTEFAVKKGSKRKENGRVAKQMGVKLIKKIEQNLTLISYYFSLILFIRIFIPRVSRI